MFRALSVAALFGAVYGQNATQNTSLPTIDLGYEIYRAASFNVRISDFSRSKAFIELLDEQALLLDLVQALAS